MKKFFVSIFVFFLATFLYSQESSLKNKTAFVLIQSGNLNLREAPSKGKVKAKLQKGEKITILQEAEEDSNWLKVKTADNTVGFVSREFISFHPLKSLADAKIIGVVSQGTENEQSFSVGRIVGVKIGKKWTGSGDALAEYVYLGKESFKNSVSFPVIGNGRVAGKVNFKEISGWGCQEIKGFKGSIDITNPKEDETLVFSMGTKLKPIELKPIKILLKPFLFYEKKLSNCY